MSALLIVDLQQGFVNDHTDRLPQQINSFIRRSEGRYDRIVASKFRNDPWSPFVALRGYSAMTHSPDTDLALDDHENVQVVEKSTYNLPSQTASSLMDHEVHICGIDSEACVPAIAMQLFDLKVDVRVIEDLCGSSGGTDRNRSAVEVLRRTLGRDRVITSNAAIHRR